MYLPSYRHQCSPHRICQLKLTRFKTTSVCNNTNDDHTSSLVIPRAPAARTFRVRTDRSCLPPINPRFALGEARESLTDSLARRNQEDHSTATAGWKDVSGRLHPHPWKGHQRSGSTELRRPGQAGNRSTNQRCSIHPRHQLCRDYINHRLP